MVLQGGVAGAAVSLAILARRSRRSRRRLARPDAGDAGRSRAGRPAGAGALALVGGAAGVAGIAAAGPVAALIAAAVVGLALRRRLGGSSDGDLSLPLDLVAGALACGATPPAALTAAATAATARVAVALKVTAASLARGDDPTATWAQLAEQVPGLAPAARACARAAISGAPVADELHRLAAATRVHAQTTRRRRLQRSGVWLVLPLGTCFLPAFVLLGVVPLVAGTVPTLLR